MGISDKAEAYRQRLLGLIPSLVYSGGAGGGCEPVQFDLYPRDYLAYAEASLEEQSTESRVRCVGHLKRAVDCQIALFFCCLGLEDYFKGKRLNFHRRLEFIKALGLVSPRSISRLNSIRNRVEHEFVDPKDADLLLYFDLCQCFVNAFDGWCESSFIAHVYRALPIFFL